MIIGDFVEEKPYSKKINPIFIPYFGNPNDLCCSEQVLEQQVINWKDSDISVDGLFLNTDAGLDSKKLRRTCFKHIIQLNESINPRNISDLAEYDYYSDGERPPNAV